MSTEDEMAIFSVFPAVLLVLAIGAIIGRKEKGQHFASIIIAFMMGMVSSLFVISLYGVLEFSGLNPNAAQGRTIWAPLVEEPTKLAAVLITTFLVLRLRGATVAWPPN